MTQQSWPAHPPREIAPAATVVPGPFPGQHPLKRKLGNDWKVVKRARFNASKRLERKQSAGIVTLAIVALYGGLISVFNLMFKHRVGGDTRDILEYVAVVSSWLTLIIGLTEQQKCHAANARELHDCARDVNDLQKHLAAAPIVNEAQIGPFLARYGQIMDRCRPNHDDVDYRLAEATPSREERAELEGRARWNAASQRRALAMARAAHVWSTYWFYVMIAVTPPLVGLVLWWLVPAAPPA